jgi:PII-like signaling protein
VIDDSLKVTSYFGERTRVGGRFFSDVLFDTLEEYDVSTSILLRATGGFGLRHHLRSDQTLTMSEDPSVMAIAADTRSRIELVVPRLAEMHPRGMLTIERARLVRHDVPQLAEPDLPHRATKLTIYVGRRERVHRVPAYVTICDLLHRHGVTGASVLLGVDGTSHGVRERARFWDRNHDVPTMVLAVGDAARIRPALPELGALLQRPLLTVERVTVCKHDGQLVSRPPELPEHDADGRALWQKLMIYSSESQLHRGQPLHREIIRRLRLTNARGVTALRGVWGFHGDHLPHGDRFFQLGRRVPVVTVVVDSPRNIARSFDVIDDITAEHGLVTCELVPALQDFGTDRPQDGLRLARRHP